MTCVFMFYTCANELLISLLTEITWSSISKHPLTKLTAEGLTAEALGIPTAVASASLMA